jgi:hypothetical protein
LGATGDGHPRDVGKRILADADAPVPAIGVAVGRPDDVGRGVG